MEVQQRWRDRFTLRSLGVVVHFLADLKRYSYPFSEMLGPVSIRGKRGHGNIYTKINNWRQQKHSKPRIEDKHVTKPTKSNTQDLFPGNCPVLVTLSGTSITARDSPLSAAVQWFGCSDNKRIVRRFFAGALYGVYGCLWHFVVVWWCLQHVLFK